MRIAYNIDWDTDGEEIDLPLEVKIPDEIEEGRIADYISDIFGWCIFGLQIK